jgi:hypothetical protein
LVRKGYRPAILASLETLSIDCFDERHKPSRYVGSSPAFLALKGFPSTEAEVDALATIMPSVESLKLRAYIDKSIHQQWVPKIGPSMGQLKKFRALSSDCGDFLELFAPYLKALRDLDYSWADQDSLEALKAISKHVSRLRLLRISVALDAEEFIDLPSLADNIPEVDNLVIPAQFLVDLTATEGLESLEKKTGSMKRVYVAAIGRDEQTAFFIPVYGYLFAMESEPNVVQECLRKLVDTGVNHTVEEGDTTLVYLIVGEPTMPALKIRLLLESGADAWLQCPASLHSYVGFTTGNALHEAVMAATQEVASVLCDCLDWDAVESLDQLRMSSGFLPTHLAPQDFGAWTTVYNCIKKRFPDVDLLGDNANTQGWIPIYSVLGSRPAPPAEDQAIPLLKFILQERPESAGFVPQSGISLLSLAIQSFSFDLDTFPPAKDAIPIIETLAKARLGDLSQRAPCTLKDLEFMSAMGADVLGMYLFGCLIYLPRVFDLVVANESAEVRTACLRRLASQRGCREVPGLFKAIQRLLEEGVQQIKLEAEEEEDMDEVSSFLDRNVLFSFWSSMWSYRMDIFDTEEYLSSHQDLEQHKTSEFWECFWKLADAPIAPIGEKAPKPPQDLVEYIPDGTELIICSEPHNIEKLISYCMVFYPAYLQEIKSSLEDLDLRDVTPDRPTSRFHGLLEYFRSVVIELPQE